MTIVSACQITTGKHSRYYVVFDTPYAGASVMNAMLDMHYLDFELFNVKMFNTMDEAYAYGYDYAFGEGAYEQDYKHTKNQ